MDYEQLELLINEVLNSDNNNKIDKIMDLIENFVNSIEDTRY
tara:strand:- start:310 stop:435 length:126 start_codon:yes stop_codon:yes gene_type:complete